VSCCKSGERDGGSGQQLIAIHVSIAGVALPMASLLALALQWKWDECLGMLARGEGDVNEKLAVRAASHGSREPTCIL